MSKEITKKLLESGIIDRTIARMMERWGMLSPDELELATKPKAVIHETLTNFIEELELLSQPESIERPITKLDDDEFHDELHPCGQRWCPVCQ